MKSYNGETGLAIDSTIIRSYRLYSFTNKDAIFGYVGYNVYYFTIDNQGHILSYISGTGPRYLYEYEYSVSNSGSYSIIGSSADIFRADQTLEYLGRVPYVYAASKHCIFNNNDNLIYSANYEQKRILCYSYPSFELIKVIKTKAYPEMLFLRDNQLIAISRIPNWTYLYGIEKFVLE